MNREHSIPLFLWIATALVVHAVGGGGATQVSQVLEESLDIQSFAQAVRNRARLHGKPVEVSLEDDSVEYPIEELEPNEETEQKQDQPDPEDPKTEPDLEKPKEKPEEKKRPEEKKLLAEEQEKKPELDKPKLEPPAEKPPAAVVPPPQNRISVQQHVKDKNQEDNPNARFAAEDANRVEEETQARITSTDQNQAEPSPGSNFAGSDPEPGNSNEQRIAQSEERAGEKGAVPEGAQPSSAASDAARATANQPAPANAAQASNNKPAAPPAPAEQAKQNAQKSSAEQNSIPEAHSHDHGSFGLAQSRDASSSQREKRSLPEQRSNRPTDLLGFGSTGRTANGINLNLSPQMAVSAIGADRLAMERKRVGEQRLSQHRGSWKSLGLERWRPALENYVASVKPGNQTALNTARVPFAKYLNEIHNRIHSVFADHFLGSLSNLPANHPLNNPDMSTHLEVQLSGQDGRVLRLGITKSSGVTAFDVGALDSVQRAGPYGVPPGAILSSDGNVYLHWEFHRKPDFACSTYFARPYILNLEPGSAPTRVAPPGQPTYDPTPSHERTGSLRPSTGAPAGSSPAPAE